MINIEVKVIGENKNIIRKFATIKQILPDGQVLLDNDELLEKIDLVILCTGYSFNFKFLDVD
jgi:hypothetical protein